MSPWERGRGGPAPRLTPSLMDNRGDGNGLKVVPTEQRQVASEKSFK